MAGYTISEIIDMAIQTERLGAEFYAGLAEKFKKDKNLKSLFETLKDKEVVHGRRFEELKALIGTRESEDWQEAQRYLRAIMESAFFIGEGKSLPTMDKVKTVKEAVELALGFEKETLLFYLGLRTEVREKHLLDEIITEEQSHIVWLHSIL